MANITIQKNKDLVTQSPSKNGGTLMCSKRVSRSCSTSVALDKPFIQQFHMTDGNNSDD